MIPWELLDTAAVPGGGVDLRLLRRGGEYSIRLGQAELMNSRRGRSETVLGSLSCDRLKGRERPRLLVGGLGMGFTLRAVLADLGPDASVVVAELVPAVVEWARGPLSGLFAGCMEDPRVDIQEADVGELIRSGRATYDAILLDVDNGPEGLTRTANDRLYDREGLHLARAALRRHGVLAIWSAVPDARFVERLRKSGFAVEEVRTGATARGGGRHVIWFASRGD